MGLILTQTDALDYGSAYYLANASLLAYEKDEDQVQKQFKTELGLDAKLHQQGNIQVVVGINATDIVLAFRGSESPTTADGRKDWLLTNAKKQLVAPPETDFGVDFAAAGTESQFHEGFLSALASVWDAFFPVVEKEWQENERPVWVTGHSLGGALAVLAAWRLKRRWIDIHKVYTFGAPMVCNLEAVSAFNRRLGNRIHRFVNEDDLIPEFPLSNLIKNDYAHVGVREVLPSEASDVPGIRDLLELFRRVIHAFSATMPSSTIARLLWDEFGNRSRAHSIDKGYISRIAEVRQAIEDA